MMINRIIHWLIFSVVMALLPLIFNALSLATRGQLLNLGVLVSHGELLIVSAALSASGIGEILIVKSKSTISRTVAGGASLVILGLASFYFADISAGYRLGTQLDVNIICNTSFFLFACSVITGGCCIVIRGIE